MTPSQWFFKENGLTPWGRYPDFVAPKPMSGRAITRLGDMLDQAEAAESNGEMTRHVLYLFKSDYAEALAARNLYQRCKAENAKRVPTQRDAIKLKDRMYAALWHLEEIEEHPEFSTKRDWLEANSAYALASGLFEIAEQKYQSEEAAVRRRDAADRASNIVRRSYRRKSAEVHL